MSSGNPYNGFSPTERTWGAKRIRAAVARGELKLAAMCSVCERSDVPLAFHSEDYRQPLSAITVCRSCHYAIHIRFRRPEWWLARIAKLDARGWFQFLTLDPQSLLRPFDETYPSPKGSVYAIVSCVRSNMKSVASDGRQARGVR